MCYPCSHTAASPLPAQFHLHPGCHLPTHQLSWTKATPRGLPLPHSYGSRRAHTPTQLLAHRAACEGLRAMLLPRAGGEAGLRRAEDGGGRDGEGLEGALVSCGQNTLVSLQHRRRPSPSLRSAARPLSLLPSVPGGLAASPKGDFVTDTSGWGGGGQGVRHNGDGGEECAPLRRFPRMGRGGGHPSMSQLKRWCFTSMSCTPSFSGFFSFSCRMT